MLKRRSIRLLKDCALMFGLPFLSWSSGLPGAAGSSDDEDALERRLITIDRRGIAPAVIAIIEDLDRERAYGTLDESIHPIVDATLIEIENLDAAEEDKFVLETKLRSFFE